MSDTPRTDALCFDDGQAIFPTKVANLSRTLERELADKDAELEVAYKLHNARADLLDKKDATIARLREALEDLITRCDGAEGVRADGSNIQTIQAHAALGHFSEVQS